MKAFTFEVTKKIVITVEAETYMAAITEAEYDLSEGEYADSFEHAEPVLKLLDEENLT